MHRSKQHFYSINRLASRRRLGTPRFSQIPLVAFMIGVAIYGA
jgi:hypothetical protein